MQYNKLFIALGLSALITFILTRVFDVRCTVTKNPHGSYPQTVSDANKNSFEGNLQLSIVNVNIENHK